MINIKDSIGKIADSNFIKNSGYLGSILNVINSEIRIYKI